MPAMSESFKQKVEYEVVLPTSKDIDRIMDFLKEHFYPEEPIAQSLGGYVGGYEEDGIKMNFINGLTVMAIEKETEKILGVSVNDIYEKKSETEIEDMIKKCEKHNDPYKWVIKCFEKMDQESNFWSQIGSNRCSRIAGLCTDKNYRNMGIASALVEKSLILLKEYKYIRAEPSEIGSCRILLKMGFNLFHEMDLHDFRDENGNILFNTKSPNNYLRVLIKEQNSK